jgi:hypothetical protein
MMPLEATHGMAPRKEVGGWAAFPSPALAACGAVALASLAAAACPLEGTHATAGRLPGRAQLQLHSLHAAVSRCFQLGLGLGLRLVFTRLVFCENLVVSQPRMWAHTVSYSL